MIKKEKEVKKNYSTSIRRMIERVDNEPKLKMIYSGIKENSIGFIFGPSKCGKTTFCENLGLSIVAGHKSFLGKPIEIENRKVLFISLEEFYSCRTERNKKQIEKISLSESDNSWIDNFIVADEDMPRYLLTDEDWLILKEQILSYNPGIVFIDSFSRLCSEQVEDSTTTGKVMKRLRELSNEVKTTIAVIHHTPKLGNSPLSVHTMAGSRILAQEADFMIGLNKTINGKLYLKEVAFRYAAANSDSVDLMSIDPYQWMKIDGKAQEFDLLSEFDGRRDDHNKIGLYDFINGKANENDDGIVTAEELKVTFVDTKIMTKQSMYNNLKKLESQGKVKKIGHGQYKVAA